MRLAEGARDIRRTQVLVFDVIMDRINALTAAGKTLETMNGVSGHSSSSFETWALTASAPCAVSETPAKPISFSAAAS